MGFRGKLCFYTTISHDAFWGSLLPMIDGWLKLVGTDVFSFLGFWQILPVVFCRVNLSTALNLVYRNSFPKLANFPSYFTQLCNFPGGATFEKHADPEKKNRNSRKSRANSRSLLEPFLRSRKEEILYGHCAMNNARRILSKGSTLLRVAGFGRKNFVFERITMRISMRWRGWYFPHEIGEFIITRTWRPSRDRKFQQKKIWSARDVVSWYKYFSGLPSITNSKEPQNGLLLMVVQNEVFHENPFYFTQQGS